MLGWPCLAVVYILSPNYIFGLRASRGYCSYPALPSCTTGTPYFDGNKMKGHEVLEHPVSRSSDELEEKYFSNFGILTSA